MRVIAGEFKGRKLKTFKGSILRPLTDRIKTSIFDYLNKYIRNSNVLDLFSGTGSFGIEALSREAEFVVFVEKFRPAVNLIKNNLKSVSCSFDKCEIVCKDAMDYLQKNNRKFDIIFADPPYKYPFAADLVDLVTLTDSLTEKGLFIIRHHENIRIPDSGNLKLMKTKKFAVAYLRFFINEEK